MDTLLAEVIFIRKNLPTIALRLLFKDNLLSGRANSFLPYFRRTSWSGKQTGCHKISFHSESGWKKHVMYLSKNQILTSMNSASVLFALSFPPTSTSIPESLEGQQQPWGLVVEPVSSAVEPANITEITSRSTLLLMALWSSCILYSLIYLGHVIYLLKKTYMTMELFV